MGYLKVDVPNNAVRIEGSSDFVRRMYEIVKPFLLDKPKLVVVQKPVKQRRPKTQKVRVKTAKEWLASLNN